MMKKRPGQSTDKPFIKIQNIGIYEDDYLGLLEVVEDEGELIAFIGPKDKARLIHKNRNTFTLEFISRPYMSRSQCTFEDNGDKVTGIKYFNRFFKKKNL